MTNVLLAFGPAQAFFKATYDHVYYSEHFCSPLSYELFIDIGTFVVFDKDNASDVAYFAEYLGNCLVNSLTYPQVSVIDTTNGVTFIDASPTHLLFDDNDASYSAGYFDFTLQIDLTGEGFGIETFPLTLLVNPLTNNAPTITNVDCADF